MRMELVELDNENKLIRDYRDAKNELMKNFSYDLTDNSFRQRLDDLKERNFKREQLADVLISLNRNWSAPDSTFHNIERLRDKESTVVIGGQQAGLLTGPMYTVNKIISIIRFAKEQEKKWKKPVIPVFWIAGEDHDFEEINHVYVPNGTTLEKVKLTDRFAGKIPISDLGLDQTAVKRWVNRIFEQLKETENTKKLYESIEACLLESKTYVDFFAQILHRIFPNEGLVLIDSGHPDVRRLESEYFSQIIEKQPELSEGVYIKLQQMIQQNYPISLDIEKNDGHLFYHDGNKERILLKRDEAGNWIGKQNEVMLTNEAMLEMASNQPEQLSNNVVTRPLMQELLFPTLAFVGGPGEISYWSVLKPAFEALHIAMPPVLPRTSFTYIDRNTEKVLRNNVIPLKDALRYGLAKYKANWLMKESYPPVNYMVSELKKMIEHAHEPLRSAALGLGKDLGKLAEKNLLHLHRELDYLESRMLQAIEAKFSREISAFDMADSILCPKNGLQERVWNPLFFINEYGIDFLRQLASDVRCSFGLGHYIVYL